MNSHKLTRSDLFYIRNNAHNSKEDLIRCTRCGCFNCLHIFLAKDISEWVYEKQGNRRRLSALCPFCEAETIIGDDTGFPLNKELLMAMKKLFDTKGREDDVF